VVEEELSGKIMRLHSKSYLNNCINKNTKLVNRIDTQIITLNLETLEKTFCVLWMNSRKPYGWKKMFLTKKIGDVN